jgi:hypothetical protein
MRMVLVVSAQKSLHNAQQCGAAACCSAAAALHISEKIVFWLNFWRFEAL